MKFFAVVGDSNPITGGLLQKACAKREISYEAIDPVTFSFATSPTIKKGDLLYRVKKGWLARMVEIALMKSGVTTFYRDPSKGEFSTEGGAEIIVNMHNQAPVPKTVFGIPEDITALMEYVAYLGGFPVIIKVLGKSHGAGVMRVDSKASLLSIAGFLRHSATAIVMRQYIESKEHARLIVLGDKVIDSIVYRAKGDDFRTNVGTELDVVPQMFSKDIQNTAVLAAHSINLDFAGVDVLLGADGKHYVAEVNFPAFFPRAQHITGVDIAGQMIDYLMQKTKA